MKYYIYEYWDPKHNEPFYVGAGQNDRMYDHLIEATNYNQIKERKGLNHFKIKKILKIWNQKLQPNIKIVFRSDDLEVVYNKEIELIKFYGRRDLGLGPLTNLTDGGEGLVNRSPEMIRKNIEAAMETKANWSEEKRKEISENCSDGQIERWYSLSDEERRLAVAHLRNWWDSLSMEEKEENSTIRLLNWMNNNPDEVKEAQEKAAEAIRNMSPEKKQQHSKNVSNAVKIQWKDPILRAKRLEGLKKGREAKRRKMMANA